MKKIIVLGLALLCAGNIIWCGWVAMRQRDLNLLIGNSSHSWPALNGEMNEGRPKMLDEETRPIATRYLPRLEMFQYYFPEPYTEAEIRQMFELSLSHKVFFGCSANAQTVKWLPLFEQIRQERGFQL